MHRIRNLIAFIKALAYNYSEDRISTFSAALSYYTIFSLPAILLISIWIIGYFLGNELAEYKLLDEIRGVFSQATITQIQTVIDNSRLALNSHTVRIVGILVLLYAASGFFLQLQGGLNYIWKVKKQSESAIFKIIKDRLLTIIIVLSIAFLLLLSIVISTLITGFGVYLSNFYGINLIIERIVESVTTFFLITILTALIFKILPSVKLTFREVIYGALWTSFLFNLGKILLGVYISYANITNIFGVAGSLIVLLIWIYYSAQIFFIGAEITKLLFIRDTQINIDNKNN